MEVHLQSLEVEVWQSIENGYNVPVTTPINPLERRHCECNARERNALLCGLADIGFTKVMHFDSTKDVWDKLRNIYEGDEKVKKEKLHTYPGRYKSLRMKVKKMFPHTYFELMS